MNFFDGVVEVAGEAPNVPWAVYLADGGGRFRLLCFDLDGKTPDAEVLARRDSEVLCGLLASAGLESVVCDSGGGGRHVWVSLTDGVEAELVASLARLVKHLCPSLDMSPLSNAASGCVRPPGSPHRLGGVSKVIAGDVASLLAPTATRPDVLRLLETVAAQVQPAEAEVAGSRAALVPVDDDGRLYLLGSRRGLPATAAAAFEQVPAPGADASGVLWTGLLGAASARWRYSDVEELLETAPGMEHARTERGPGGRRRRGPAGSRMLLRRQWDRAVRYVAEHGGEAGTDPTFPTRAWAAAAVVRQVQARADAAGGRWTVGGGPTDRRVLDALCILSLQAVRTAVEADVRRLAVMCGIARETARRALWRLASDGWIQQTRASEGNRASHWTITPQDDVHRGTEEGVPQGFPPPAVGAALLGPAERTALLATLQLRADSAAQDLFTPVRGLGYLAGNLYARTSPATPTSLGDLAAALGMGWDQTEQLLHELAVVGVLVHSRAGWTRAPARAVQVAASALGVEGVLEERKSRYFGERRVWGWWQAELSWLRRRRHDPLTGERKPARRTGLPRLEALFGPDLEELVRYRYPRTAEGRPDHAAARAFVAAAADHGRDELLAA